jgi:putative transposase
MRLVEQHRIDRHDPRFAAIAAAFASKHLYNAALYLTWQAFIYQQQIIAYEELAHVMKTSVEFRALPAKVAQWALRQVALAWKSYFAACAAWEADPSRFVGHPRLPKYLDKQGRNLLTSTEQAIRRAPRNRGYVVPRDSTSEWRRARGLSTRCGSYRMRLMTLWRCSLSVP